MKSLFFALLLLPIFCHSQTVTLIQHGSIFWIKNSTTEDSVRIIFPSDTTAMLSAYITALNAKQATLVSATNIKTINGGSVLGSGDLTVAGAAAWGSITGTLSSQTDLQSALDLKGNITSQTFVTPVLGVATATTINKVTITQPANGATLTIPDGLTLNAGAGGTLGSNAFTSTAYVPQTTTVNGHALSGNVTVTAGDVSLGNVTNESKATMFTTPTFTGHPTIEGVTSTGATGTGNFVFSASPTLTGTTTATTLTATTLTAVAGAGFQNMVVETSGSSATYNLPAELQITGAKFKITIIGGGGQGGGTNTTAGQMGGGGGSGGLVVVYLTYVAGQNTVTYTVGAGGSTSTGNATGQTGTNSSIVYNSVTYTASGGVGGLSGSSNGAGGAGGAASGGTLNIAGFPGASSGTMAATSNFQGYGGNTPLGYGQGGAMVSTAAGAAGLTGDGFGSGGGGGRNGTGTTARNGGAGKIGVVIIEY